MLLPGFVVQTHTNTPVTPVPYVNLLPQLSTGFPNRTQQALEAQQYDANQAALKAEQAQAVQNTTPPPSAPQTGSKCLTWLSQAGVSDIPDALKLISMESGCNPYAVNPSSGACGVAQELPCGKSGCTLGNGACEVNWMNTYVISRYGSWANAWQHELDWRWY